VKVAGLRHTRIPLGESRFPYPAIDVIGQSTEYCLLGPSRYAGERLIREHTQPHSNDPLCSWISKEIFVLNGFFDGTASPDGPQFAGVAGYLFDDDGLARFRQGYADLTEEYRREYNGLDIGVFHATECCGKKGYKQYAGWIPRRLASV
jgi:hypothetical protein